MSRLVVVTGGGTGMGRSIAGGFASAGDEVVILGRRLEKLEEVAAEYPAGAVVPVAADLSVEDEIFRVREVLAGRTVDVLVNNAGGIVKDEEPGLAGAFDAWRRTLEANLLAPMMLTEALWSAFRRPGGRIVNIGSIAGQRGGGDAYGAAKAALAAWGFELAGRGGKDGITVNTVAPGYVQDTEFFNESGRSGRHDRLVAETLVGRAGRPGDIAAVVTFLASEQASWITGQVIAVNGGALLSR
ncbi:MAG: SDR family NAD(P)-dependent oxidoreductase [Catenulispora sp.]